MTKRTGLVVAVAAALAILGYALFFRETDESRIRKRLAALAAAVRIDPAARDPLARALRIERAFAAGVSPGVRVQVPELGDVGGGRDGLLQLAVSSAGMFSSMQLGFERVRVQLAPGSRSAAVDASAVLSTTEHGGGSQRRTKRLDLRFENVEGEWRLAHVVALDDE